MTDSTTSQMIEQSLTPHSALKQLDKLVGRWNVSGPDIHGQVVFEWMDGGFFLMQRVDFVHGGNHIKGIEIIGYDRKFGTTEPSTDIKSHWFDNTGNTFDYTYEVDNATLTIWGGDKGSPAYYKGQWSDDGNINSGAWVYPGGGYESTMTRVK
ncbi:MAG: hypothetical protein ABI947_05470 [Chloroflexota bacterium]